MSEDSRKIGRADYFSGVFHGKPHPPLGRKLPYSSLPFTWRLRLPFPRSPPVSPDCHQHLPLHAGWSEGTCSSQCRHLAESGEPGAQSPRPLGRGGGSGHREPPVPHTLFIHLPAHPVHLLVGTTVHQSVAFNFLQCFS